MPERLQLRRLRSSLVRSRAARVPSIFLPHNDNYIPYSEGYPLLLKPYSGNVGSGAMVKKFDDRVDRRPDFPRRRFQKIGGGDVVRAQNSSMLTGRTSRKEV